MADTKLYNLEKLDKLAEQLIEMPKKVANKVIRTGLRTAAKMRQADAKSNAPKDTGVLQKSIKVRSSKRKKDHIRINTASVSDARNLAQEYGTKHVDPQPFLVPAGDKNETQAIHIIADSIEASIIEFLK